jgi:uncharacterized cupredoxin-like copper-binding protein
LRNQAEPTERRRAHAVMWLVVVAVGLVSCTGASDSSVTATSPDAAAQVVVAPNLDKPTILINVTLTDEGFEPSTIFMPAGRHVRLVLRNRGTAEHHFRVPGLIPFNMAWLLAPELDEYDLLSMTEEELAEHGITAEDDADIEHVLHHLSPQFVPTKEESPAGVKPLFGEVHGYVGLGTTDTLSFFPTNTGTFISQDVLHPEITGRVVVYEEKP